MRILVVSQYFWPENFRINDVVAGLIERGHEVTVLTGQPNYPAGRFFPGYGWFKRTRERYLGAEIIRIPLLPRGAGGSVRLALNYLSFVLSACLLGPLYCRARYDVIFVYGPSPITVALPALLLKALRKAPVMLWVLDLWPESLSATAAIKSQSILKAVERLVRFIYRHCDRILVQSQAFFQPMERLGVAGSKIAYFPSSAEDVYGASNGAESATMLSNFPVGFRVMFAGNVGAAQDFETILRAAELLKWREDIHWLIVGDGRMLDWVKTEVESRALKSCFHLLGRHPLEEMPKFYQSADVMLVTLRRDPIFSLTIPGKIQSYMAAGKPILAALDGEGARIVQESDAGLACPAESAELLASAVLDLAARSRLDLDRMGRQGRSYYETHFERKMLLAKLEGWMHEFSQELNQKI